MKTIYLLIPFAILLISCSSENKKQPTEDAAKTNVTKKAEGYDISKLNVCELIPSELVANTLGGTVLKPSQRTNVGSYSQGCEYQIDPPGKDNYEYCAIWINSPSLYSDAQSNMETIKGLGHKAEMEQLQDFGDEAYVIHDKTEEQSIIYILLKDKAAFEIKAEYFDDAKKLAELSLLKIKEEIAK